MKQSNGYHNGNTNYNHVPRTRDSSSVNDKYKFGDKNTLLFTISLYLVVIAYSAFLSNAIEFYILASMVGAIQGGIQSISRSYYATLIPPDESGEYFGFYNMFGRAGAFMGPALVAIFVTFFETF